MLNNNGADLTLSGAFLAGLLAGPYAGAIVGVMLGIPPLFAGEWGALPFAIGCGFAGGGLREICPKEAIWHFSPLFFTGLHRHVWRLVRRFEIDWVVILLAAPIALAIIAQAVGNRWRPRLFVDPRAHARDCGSPCWSATVLSVAIPIKIWNSARIEHRLQEQEKLLMESRLDALASQINPHFLFNTLTSISSLTRSQPETARTLIVKLSGLLRRLLRSQDHFVTLREELEAIDEYLDIESIRFGPQLKIEKHIDPATLDLIVPSMILQPLVENSIKHGLAQKLGEGRITIRSLRERRPRDHRRHRQRHRHSRRREAGRVRGTGIGLRNVNERLRVIYGANYQLQLDSVPGPGHVRADRHPGAPGLPAADHGMTGPTRAPDLRAIVVDDEQLARDELCFLLQQLGGVEVVAPGGKRRRGADA